MVDIGEAVGQFAPQFEGSAIAIFILGLVIVAVFGIVIAGIIYWYLMKKRYNKEIIVFENVGGTGYQVTFRDKARTVKLGKGGEEVLRLRKLKTYRPAYGKRMGKNTYWFAVGSDGYWYNVTIGDLDKELTQLNVKPTSTAMRYQYVALEQNINRRDDQEGFWNKYGQTVISIAFIAIIGVFTFLIFREFSSITAGSQQAIAAAERVVEAAGEIVGALDNIKSGGSGLK